MTADHTGSAARQLLEDLDMDTTDTARTAPTHTPGPWEWSRDAVPEWCTQVSIYDGDGDRIATVFKESVVPLIAAAPDMLAALESIAECGDSGSRDVARAAIAQARGDAR